MKTPYRLLGGGLVLWLLCVAGVVHSSRVTADQHSARGPFSIAMIAAATATATISTTVTVTATAASTSTAAEI